MPEVHILRGSKKWTESLDEGACGYVSERSETKDQIPLSANVVELFFNKLLIKYLILL